MQTLDSPEWLRQKRVTALFGIGRTPLERLAKIGAIRSSNLVEPGKNKGTRLYNAASVRDYINAHVEGGAQ